jgi:hypothetical protein
MAGLPLIIVAYVGTFVVPILACIQFVIGVVLIISAIVKKKRKSHDYKQYRKGGIIILIVSSMLLMPNLLNALAPSLEYRQTYNKLKEEAVEKNLEWVDMSCADLSDFPHFFYKGEEYVEIDFRFSDNNKYIDDDIKYQKGKLVATTYYTDKENTVKSLLCFGRLYESTFGYNHGVPMLVFTRQHNSVLLFVKISDFNRAVDTLPVKRMELEGVYYPEELKYWEDYVPYIKHDCAISN